MNDPDPAQKNCLVYFQQYRNNTSSPSITQNIGLLKTKLFSSKLSQEDLTTASNSTEG